jgi:hypothetical protein
VPAPFKVAMTMQATVTTDLSASQTHIAAHGDVLVALQQQHVHEP